MASHDPLTVPSDYAGLKVRVAGSPGKIYESVGATNVALPAEEIYQSLERGVIDTVMFPFDNIAANKINELVDNVTYDGIGAYATSVFAINKDKWDELDEDARDVMTEVTAEYNDGQAMEAVKAADQATCDTLVDAGMKFHVFQDPGWWLEDDQFDPMFQDYVALVEAAGYDANLADEIWAKFMELADAAEAEVEYEDGTVNCFEANAE
jgi:TRAP-type C4-dicarboxylate transport system substrate-binding protein